LSLIPTKGKSMGYQTALGAAVYAPMAALIAFVAMM